MLYNIFYDWNGLNTELFISMNHSLNHDHGNLPEAFMSITSVFAIENFAILYLAICAYYYFHISFYKKNIVSFNKVADKLVPIGLSYAFFGLIFAFLKFTVNMPRPYCSLEPSMFTTILNTDAERCFSAFPSAHTGIVILLTYSMWGLMNKYGRVCFGYLILIVTISRISLAMHYPADIIYSVILTLLICRMSHQLYLTKKESFFRPITNKIFSLVFFHKS